ncbi:Stk1 family PASTA domain-containing Ser/Thr kinase [Jiangella rhizosphaerae]|uniref:non-specific serine/threonine protein kinase n=1 Tax=Jiangella rhizosphaerae TaxID=2293569 RepID=A0A418KH96_9ACTN|nr:Stk1 family PASTA domain-containing Ser/Thr kinase [Jiangella rhizosphaerae]RIQ11503.1 Stk1 family PASTA domain-containing Ser/Thr kinase [Jiangella rhizosphaerae]
MNELRLLGDRYELGEVIGRGGMAEVRRGRDSRLGRIVALKMLRVDHASDATFQARFRREAQSAASLNHRNIVAVYDTGEDYIDGHRIPYIVMEYVEGQTLREMLQEHQRFTPERSIEILISTLDALEYSHRAGIVHRDIKPGNIMITSGGEVKVTDFGIARSLADTGMALTQTAAVVGTAQYISPEQARGEQADARSDLYASGCVLYELLTGRPPFIGESLVSVAVSHVREMPTPPSALDPNITPELDAIVMKALAKDRLHRYQSAYEMRTDLERAAAGLPVAAAADTSAATQLIANAAPTVAAGALPLDDATPYPDELEDEEDEEQRKGFSWWAVVLGALAVLAIAGLIGYLVFNSNGPAQATVPNLVGMTAEQAEARLTEENLEVTAESEAVEDEAQIGTVIRQDPRPSTQLDEGSTVTIVVGVAPDMVSVPSVQGRTIQEAEDAIREAGLTPGNRVPQNSNRPENEVLGTEPAGGESVAPGTTVDIIYSTGTQPFELPELIGMTRGQAEAELERLGLVPDVVTETTADVPDGQVFDQSPDPGAEVEEGDTIIITVAEAPEEEPSDEPTETETDTPTDEPTETETETPPGDETGDPSGTEGGNESGEGGTESGEQGEGLIGGGTG